MSRLAAAFRKASAAGSQGGTLPSMWDTVSGPSGGVPVPWDFAESLTPAPLELATPATRLAAVALPATLAAPASVTSSDEEVAALIRRIYEPGGTANRRAILFSGVDGEGAAARVSARVAAVLASQTSGSVCLVEANLRSPVLDRVCGGPAGAGLSELLLGGGQLRPLLRPVFANLWLLPAGARGEEALQRLTAEQLRPRVRELRATFDYLVVNAAAATRHRDAAILAPLTDGIVLVVAASGTRREAARRAVDDLQQTGATVLGAVLADRTFPIPDALYRRL